MYGIFYAVIVYNVPEHLFKRWVQSFYFISAPTWLPGPCLAGFDTGRAVSVAIPIVTKRNVMSSAPVLGFCWGIPADIQW